MLMDQEKNKVQILATPNAHVLVLGKSGMGKTYFICRELEQQIAAKRSMILFDFSGSYTTAELEKMKFSLMDQINVLNPVQEQLIWHMDAGQLVSTLTAAFVNSLQIRSYYQKKLLKEAVQTAWDDYGIVNIGNVMNSLESMNKQEEMETETKQNIVHLLTRLELYSETDGIGFCGENRQMKADTKKALSIFQLSELPELQRQFFTNLLVEILWAEIRSKRKAVDIVVLDEFQFMSIHAGTALSSMLREGRKFGLGLYLSSQFIGNYEREEVETLLQCGNILYFRPTIHDIKKVANMIAPENAAEWRRILERLQVGELVLKGAYALNGSQKRLEDLIICKVL